MTDAPKQQVTRIAAYGFVVRDGRILLCRLSSDPAQEGISEENRGRWTLPGGGIDFGEAPADACVREVFEETGLRVRVEEVVDVDSLVLEHRERVWHALRIIYRAEVVDEGALVYEKDGSTDMCAFVTRDEALALPLVGLARHGVELAFPD